MKILFVVCPHEFNSVNKLISVQLPVNVLYLATCVIKYGHEAKIIDYNVEKFSKEGFIEIIKKEQPTAIGFSCMTPSIENGAYLAGIIKDKFLEIITIVGGPHSNAIPEQTLKEFKSFDFVMLGDAEYTIVEFCEALEKKRQIKEVHNLIFRNNKQFIITEKKVIGSLDNLPFPKRELVNLENYKKNHLSKGFSRKVKSMQEVLTTRGCPNKCIFCLTNISYDRVYFRSSKNVIAELEYCVKKRGAMHIYIMDDTFVSNKHLVKDCCRFFRENEITWHCNASINFVTKEIIRLMSISGCRGICYGVESGSQRVLDYIKKNITVNQIKNVFEWSHEYGIRMIEGTFIIGSSPYETIDDFYSTLDIIKKIKPDIINVTKITPFPGTESYNLMRSYISGNKWSDFYLIDSKPQWRTKNFTDKQLVRLQRKMLISFYLSPSYVFRRIAKLRNLQELIYWCELGMDYLKKLVTNKSI